MNNSVFSDYLELTKPRITSLVLVTASLGFFLGAEGKPNAMSLCWFLLGTAMISAGSAALNHYLERDADSRMLRTQNRPLPSGRMSPANAMTFGICLILVGVFLLWGQLNLLTAFFGLLTAFLYVLVYTPMKRISWLNTTIGAIPGALPPVGGWAAATGDAPLAAWTLFLIMFAWQHPHFYSIAWMYKDDYQRGGFKMLPVVEPDGRSTFMQINGFNLVLILLSILPFWLGLSGRLYLTGAMILGTAMLRQGFSLTASQSHSDAKKLLRASVIYLPVLFALIILDYTF